MRFFQYSPELEKQGFIVQHLPLFQDDYIESLQCGHTNRYMAIRALVRRIQALRTGKRFDVIWVEKDALPWLPALMESNLIPKNVPLVLDYDDAVFHQYDMHPNPVVRLLFEGKHPTLMRRATLVVAGNHYIADFALRAGARWVQLLPTVVDLDRYKQVRTQSYVTANEPLTVGWIGQRSTASFLLPLAPVFERLVRQGLMQFVAIGIDTSTLGLPMVSEAWSEATEVTSIQRFDVGIMPLDDGPFERGKCGYKLVQYMAAGLPVVASPIGVNTTLVEHGVNGFLANSLSEWESALRTLAADPVLRYQMGQAGRTKVKREYCLQVTAPLLAEWFAEAVSETKVAKRLPRY